jgi:hypothetical protein
MVIMVYILDAGCFTGVLKTRPYDNYTVSHDPIMKASATNSINVSPV